LLDCHDGRSGFLG
jgi:hypothetical protein